MAITHDWSWDQPTEKKKNQNPKPTKNPQKPNNEKPQTCSSMSSGTSKAWFSKNLFHLATVAPASSFLTSSVILHWPGDREVMPGLEIILCQWSGFYTSWLDWPACVCRLPKTCFCQMECNVNWILHNFPSVRGRTVIRVSLFHSFDNFQKNCMFLLSLGILPSFKRDLYWATG